MSTTITVYQDFDLHGTCPVINSDISLTATYSKYQPLGDTNIYAIPTSIDCPHGSKCPDPAACPIVRQKKFW